VNSKSDRYFVPFTYAIYVLVLVKTAWLSDDSFITLRTVDNFIKGYGLTWNVAERVQAYTHPLWLFVLSIFYFVSREPYFTTLALSMAVSLAAVALVWRASPSRAAAIIAIVTLTLSKAFTDFSTSGLENPLTHLLVALFFIVYLQAAFTPRRYLLFTLIAALGMVNRLDTALIYAPALLFTGLALWRERKLRWPPLLGQLLLGLLPITLWECFSLLYYGFPFPNTYFAKLAMPTNRVSLIAQGVSYFFNSLSLDPLTLLTIAGGIIAALLNKSLRGWCLAFGIVLYLGYIVWIGGDYMSGRFFTAPLMCAVVWLAVGPYFASPDTILLPLAAIILIGVLPPLSPIRSDHLYGTSLTSEQIFEDDKRIADGRATFYQYTGLLTASANHSMPHMPAWIDAAHSIRQTKTPVFSNPTIGMIGYYVGQNTFVIDEFALGDALLARLPVDTNRRWRPGHLWRVTPLGACRRENGTAQFQAIFRE
jgi:arabinofuranosyltransferase